MLSTVLFQCVVCLLCYLSEMKRVEIKLWLLIDKDLVEVLALSRAAPPRYGAL